MRMCGGDPKNADSIAGQKRKHDTRHKKIMWIEGLRRVASSMASDALGRVYLYGQLLIGYPQNLKPNRFVPFAEGQFDEFPDDDYFVGACTQCWC